MPNGVTASGTSSFPLSPISLTILSNRCSNAASSSCSASHIAYHIRVPMIRPTTSRTITCQQHDGIVTRTHDLLSRLTPPLRSVVFLHHQRDHVQLLLVGVVGLQTTLRKQATDTWHRPTHEWDPSQQLQTFASSTVQPTDARMLPCVRRLWSDAAVMKVPAGVHVTDAEGKYDDGD